MNALSTLLQPFENIPFHVEDLDQTDPYNTCLEYMVWTTFLGWLPDSHELPRSLDGGWSIQRDSGDLWAVLIFEGDLKAKPAPYVAQGPRVPSELPFDPFPQRVYAVGMLPDWKSLFRVDGIWASMKTWRDVIAMTLQVWDWRSQDGGPGLRPTLWTIHGYRCVLIG